MEKYKDLTSGFVTESEREAYYNELVSHGVTLLTSRFGTESERDVYYKLVSHAETVRLILLEVIAESEAAFELRIKWCRRELASHDELQTHVNKLFNNLGKFQKWYTGFLRDELKLEFQSKNEEMFSDFARLAAYCKEESATLEQKLGSCHDYAEDLLWDVHRVIGLPVNHPY